MIPKTLKNFTAFIDGVGYAGLIEEGTMPKLALVTEEYQGGGMGGKIDIDMGSVEKLEMELSFAEYNPAIISQFGKNDLPVSMRGAQGPENEAVIVETRGLLREIDGGSWKAGEKGTLKCSFTAKYLKLTIAGKELIEIDIEGLKFITGGVDRNASMKTALGISS